MMPRYYDPWQGHSLADRDYEQSQVSDKQFSPEPRRLGVLEPCPKPTPLQPRRPQEVQTRDWTDDAKGLHDFLEPVMSGPGPAPKPDDWKKEHLPPGADMEAIWVAGDQWRLTFEGEAWVGPFSQLYEFVWALYRRQQPN